MRVAFYGRVSTDDAQDHTLGLEEGPQWGEMPGQEFETGNLTIAVMDPTRPRSARSSARAPAAS